jgi:hypothetical protein
MSLEKAPEAEVWLLNEDDDFCFGEIPFMIAIEIVKGPTAELVSVLEDMLGYAYVVFLNRRNLILP